MSPTTDNNHRKILIADTDLDFLDAVLKDPKAQSIQPFLVKDVNTAQSTLSDITQRISAVVLNPKFDEPNGLGIIRHVCIHRPGTPLYIIYEGEIPFSKSEQKLLGIHDLLKKPLTYSAIVDRILPYLVSIDSTKINPSSNQHASHSATPTGTELTEDDSAFAAIRSDDFLAGSKSLFDIYLRLASGRYIKLLQAEESFEPERLASYINKGTTHFYIEKKAQAKYIGYCDKLANALIKNKNISTDMKLKGSLNHGAMTLDFLKSQGVSASTIEYAEGFANNVELLTRTTRLDLDHRILALMNDFEKYDHAVSVTLIAGLLGRALKFDGERAVKLIGLSALLHDIALAGAPAELAHEDEETVPETLKEQFHNHPAAGSHILTELQIDPVVAQAVLQHHERRTRKGFPQQLGAGAINKVAEIVGISEEFVNLVKKGKDNPDLDIATEMKQKIYQQFSFDVAEAFRKLIFEEE